MKQKGNEKRRLKKPVRIGLVIMAMVMALFVGIGVVNRTSTPVYAAEPTSDANTTGSYAQNLGDNSSTRYAGRVWTDKTVYTEDATFSVDVGNVTVENDSDFLVAYSALATTQNITGKSSVPVDVVFVIDNSNSMDNSVGGGSNQTRLAATVDAVNTSIATIMESHPDSRVAVVLYGSNARTLMPLGHYSASTSGQHRGDYIWYSSDSDWYGNTDTTFGSVANNSNLEMESGVRGTNIHSGVDTGMDILKSAPNIGEGASKHVPALILLSDGAATYAGSGNWWDPSGSQGIGSEPSVTFSMETAMHAQYQKQLVNNHYGVDADADTSCKIYTIGMGIEQLSGSERNIARLALNPGTYITENNNEANAMETAWNSYLRGQNPTMRYPADTDYWGDIEYSNYTFRHPSSGDISTIAYNDGYYSAENAEDVTNVFDDITSEIVSASAQAPTQIEGGDPLKSGYLTYTDPIGEYMEVKDIKSIIYGGKEFKQKSSSTSGNTTTYTFTGDKIESPVYGELDVSLIEISVTKGDDGNETLTVKIPAAAIPLRVNTVDIDENGAITNTNNEAYPARILYTVGTREGVDLDTLEGVSDDYISANMTEDGQYVNFYSNKYSGNTKDSKTVGDATVTLTPAETNPFFYVQENTPLYTAKNTNSPATSVQNDDTLYYFQITYYEGNQGVTTWVSRPGSTFYVNGSSANALITVDGQMNIKQGAPRLGYLTDFAQSKSENNTNTAEQVFHPVYDGNGQFTIYLGNNGLLQTDAPESLTIAKDVTAGEGLTAPDAGFTFEVTVATKAGTTGDAILTDADNQKTETELTFDADGKTTFTLKDGQSMEILNIGEGVNYTVKEINLPAGFTSDQANNTKTGTVSGTDEANIVTFTNTYNVTPVTTKDLGITLGGTKSITGRDFQADDEFVFTIAPAQATPNAPLPTEDIDQDGSATTATVNPTSGDEVSFEFGNVTFDKPGEYRYVITENTGTLPGVDYDGALYRVNIIVVDDGDGTMSLASVDGGLTGAGNANYPTNPFIQIWDGEQVGEVVSAVAFENNYSATDAKATIQGMKVLNSTNSDRILADDDFTFTVEALGYNTDGGDQFNQVPAGDPEQPMPANTEVKNVANGNVIFGEMTFTQDMIGNTYGYRITEKLPQGVDENNPTLNGITYDTSEKIVKVTVTRSDEGGQEHVVATVTPNDGTAEAAKNFTFTNTYELSSVTIGDDTDDAITVQKTFTGRTWNDSDEFEYTLKALDGAPAPDQTTLSIGKPASGTSNTASFGDITFVKEGTYKYEITETKGNLGGVDYDEHTATVTVTVTEDTATGTLSATVEYDNNAAENESDKTVQGAAAFTNTYKALFDTDTTVNLNGTKELTGKALTDSAFYFIVDPQENASGGHAPTGDSHALNPNKADGSIQLLKNVTYTEAGDYVYIIREQIPSSKALGMTYDESEYRITVTVTDDQQGNLTASKPKIEKKAAGSADYTEAGAVEFENNYKPLSGTYAPREITKVLSGDRNTPLQEGEFSFEMSVVSANPEDGITLPQEITVSNDSNGKVKFGDITFSKVGKYVVQVKEVVPDDEADKVDGVTYSTNVIKTTFDVRDEDGQLKAYVTGTEGSLTFTNEYKTTGTLSEGEIQVTKNFTGRENNEWLDSDSFQAILTAEDSLAVDGQTVISADEVPMPEGSTDGVATVDLTKNAHENVSFGSIEYSKPGTYKYSLTEAQENKIDGVIYSGAEYEVTVVVTDNGDGTLNVAPAIKQLKDNDGVDPESDVTITGSAEFNNIYQALPDTLNGKQNLTVKKNLSGRVWLDGDEWIFTLSPADEITSNAVNVDHSITMPSPNTLEMNSSTPNYQVSFGDITFRKAGTYTFTVSESGYVQGVTNDADLERTIVVDVKDDGKGQLVASVVSDKSESLEFTNTYSTTPVTLSGDSGIKVQKTLLNRNWNSDEVYSFNIKNVTENAPMPAETTINVSMPAEGNVNTAVFGDMTFDHAGTYVYTITENAGTDDSIVYDNHTATVTVAVVEDQKTGTLSAQVSYDNNDTTEGVNLTDADRANTSVAAFTNIQEMSGAIKLEGTKNISGREFIEGDSFTFTVSSDNGAPLPGETDENGQITIQPSSGNSLTFSFGEIEFTEEGEYTYHFVEENGNIDGMTYDTARRDVIIRVTNDGTGHLVPEIIAGADQLTWNNSWKLTPVTFGELNGTKNLSGKELTDGMFTFTVEALLDAPMGNTMPANFNGTATQNQDGTWTAPVELLKNIQFTEPGDYQYLIKEVNDGQPGITYDSTQYKVTLSVAIDGSVTTKIESSLNGTDWAQAESVAFNNTYTVSGTAVLDGTTSLSGTKTLTGRDWKDDDTFSFLLEAADDVTKQAVENNAIVMPDRLVAVQGAYSEDAKVPFHFGNITFTEAGEYSFRISELLPGDGGFVGNTGGITFDDHDRVINVSVHDNGRAELVAEVTNATGDNNWTNKYSVDGAEETVDTVSFGLKKVLVGKTWTNDPFTFTFTADDEESNKFMPASTEVTVSAPTASDADGNNYAEFGFGTITYDKEGTYKYTITEVAGTNKGITYDTHEAHVTVQVTDDLNGGFAISVSKDAATFTNTYHTELNYEANGAGGLSIQKRLENHDLARGQFSFTVTAADQKSIDKAGFETATYSTHEAKVPTGSTYAENLISVFGNMTFTQEDVDDTYTYTVTETVGDEAGYTYDATQYTVTITSSDDGQGNLTVTTTVSDGTNSTAYTYDNNGAVSGKAVVPFNNAYNAEGTLGGEGNTTIVATKSLTNRPIVDGEFKFNVYNKAAADAAPVTTGTSNAEGVITFGELNYSKAQLLADVNNGLAVKTTVDGKDTFEYQYTVSEDEGNFVNGVTPIASSFDIKVIVTDNNDGTLAIDVTYPGDKEGLEFRNAYGAGEDGSAVLNITGSKELKVESGDNPPDIGGKFTFTISGSEGAPMPAVTEVVNDAAGNVEFGDITYTMANVFGDTGDKEPVEGDITTLSEVREKEFTYTVTETGEVAGVTNDPEASKTFTVTVTDNGDGSISVSSNPTDNKFAFVNTYSVKPLDPSDPTDLGEDGTAPLTISKALSGRTLNDGEFTFVMNGISGTNTEGLTISAVNDASGNVIFADGFVFSAPGTYQFNISETDNALGGVAYDGSNYKANAVVTDNGDGTLSVVWNVTNAAGEEVKNITFNNTYTTTPVEVFVEMSKTLDGRKLAEGEFNFVVKDAESNVVAEVKNNENGVFGFAETYSAAGTYTYTVSEVKGDDKDITYDESVYTITVNVTDDGVGHLYATTAIAEGDQAVDGIVFKNVYTEPEKPVEPSGPSTGVWTTPAPFAVTFTASLAAILAILYRRLR